MTNNRIIRNSRTIPSLILTEIRLKTVGEIETSATIVGSRRRRRRGGSKGRGGRRRREGVEGEEGETVFVSGELDVVMLAKKLLAKKS